MTWLQGQCVITKIEFFMEEWLLFSDAWIGENHVNMTDVEKATSQSGPVGHIAAHKLDEVGEFILAILFRERMQVQNEHLGTTLSQNFDSGQTQARGSTWNPATLVRSTPWSSKRLLEGLTGDECYFSVQGRNGCFFNTERHHDLRSLLRASLKIPCNSLYYSTMYDVLLDSELSKACLRRNDLYSRIFIVYPLNKNNISEGGPVVSPIKRK